MRKIVSLLLVLTMVFTAMPIYASADKTEEVLKIVKERIPSTEEYTIFDSYSYTSSGGTVYNFHWETEGDNGKSLNVGITEQGIITNYYRYDNIGQDSKVTINKKTTDEMLPFAKELLKKINPHIYNSLEVSRESEFESIDSDNYRFVIKRVENGIPVYGDGGYLTITGDGKEIYNFNLQYTPGLSFEVTPPAIDRAQAEKLYGEKIGMNLCYMTKYENRTKTAYPVYVPNNDGNYISAITGEVVTPYHVEYDSYLMKAESAADSSAMANGALSPAEQAEIEALDGLMSKEDAENVVRSNSYIFPEGTAAELNSVRLTKDYYDSDLYKYSFNFKAENLYIYATVDAATGEILSFSRYDDHEGEEVLTQDEAAETAMMAVSKLAPRLYNMLQSSPCKYELNMKNTDDTNGHFTWTRYVNGIFYVDDTIDVKVDLKDGSIDYYNMQYSNIEFPSLENIVTEEAALERMFEEIEYKPMYYPVCSQEGFEVCDSTVMIYMAENNFMPSIDAISGERTDKVYNDGYIPEYTDISGHYAEEQINLLRKFGIGFQSESFKPDEVITEKDFLTLLMWTVSGGGVVIYDGFDYETVLRRAKNQGILDITDDGSDVSLTRETAAVLMVKMLGYGEVAALEGIYKCPFTDVTTNIGYISILNGMGVVKGNGNGLFNPAESITRADAAIMIYNYLTK